MAKTREHGAAFKIAPAKEAPATELPGLPLWGRLEWQETVLRSPTRQRPAAFQHATKARHGFFVLRGQLATTNEH